MNVIIQTTTDTDLTRLADDYARIKGEIDKLTKQLDRLKKEVKSTGRDVIEGTFCTLNINIFPQFRLDTDAVRALLTAEEIASVTKECVVEKITVKAKVPPAVI